MNDRELKESIDRLCRCVMTLTEAVSAQNELSKKAILLEQRRQLMQSGGLIQEAVPLVRPVGLDLELPPDGAV